MPTNKSTVLQKLSTVTVRYTTLIQRIPAQILTIIKPEYRTIKTLKLLKMFIIAIREVLQLSNNQRKIQFNQLKYSLFKKLT